MIHRLVESAFQTGCLSVESEGLIRQMLALRNYPHQDLEALAQLQTAIRRGQIQREAKGQLSDWPIHHRVCCTAAERQSLES